MKTDFVETEAAITANPVQDKCSPERFVVFVAGGRSPIISFENYQRAERLAVFFADLTGVRMEVFDSVKDICYFVEPVMQASALVH